MSSSVKSIVNLNQMIQNELFGYKHIREPNKATAVTNKLT